MYVYMYYIYIYIYICICIIHYVISYYNMILESDYII